MKIATSLNTLQQVALHLSGNPVSIKVHYWGGQLRHQDNPLHKHSFFEICYVLGGRGVYWEAGREYLLQKGTIFCSRPGNMHQIHKGDNLFLLWVGFEIDEAGSQTAGISMFERLAQTPHFYVSGADDSPAASIWRALMQHAEAPHPSMTGLIISLAHSLILSLQTLFCKTNPVWGELLHTRSSVLLHQAKLFIKDNLAQPLSLVDVAKYLHISPRHLSRLFSEQYGVSFTSFVRRERVRTAAELLRSTDLAIKTISEESGFSSVHYFTRVFAAEMGMTPGEYRKLSLSNTKDAT
ncbi:putative HTH-type transcriptional regulator YfiF [Collibacillus ludicampi]|uniref:HTH-type transcriptional regulator YfiF n=1 Tax=Collibacillus ludicampi TaxID=2771369 RepID=A0AAV4LJ03_9BACL|nr:AraC family transcriptional regulator [Collibacillus ludicampi]GIM47748.1 putative HTH-type transcriptional regulator YfiF [Collibacillus ludicampi]